MIINTVQLYVGSPDFQPFMEVILAEFGINRVMYGSDWPVCLLAAKYEEQLAIVQAYIATFSNYEQAKIMGQNAIEFYNLAETTPNL